MVTNKYVSLAFIALGILTTNPANADIYTLSANAIVESNNGVDGGNVFGGGDLSGDSVNITLSFDSSVMALQLNAAQSIAHLDSTIAPAYYSITVNGVSSTGQIVTIPPNTSYGLSLIDGLTTGNLLDPIDQISGGIDGSLSNGWTVYANIVDRSSSTGFVPSLSFAQTISRSTDSSDQPSYLVFQVSNGNGFTYMTADLTDISLNATQPVPEPETYAMMFAGLGLLGWVGSRRKQQAA